MIKKSHSKELESYYTGKNTIVTGGAGFIGSWLTETLVNLGSNVTVIDDLSYGKISNLENVINKITLINKDISDYDCLNDVADKPEVIFHLAAIASVPSSVNDPERTYQVNNNGTFNVLQWMRKNTPESLLVFASSAAVYGEPVRVPMDEQHQLHPVSPYGASKLSGEGYCLSYYHTYGLKCAILRLFNVYGPRQPRYVIYDFLTKLLKDRQDKLVVIGTGNQVRDFIYVTDAVKGILSAPCNNATGEIINIGTGDQTTIRSLAEKMTEILEIKIPITYTNESWKGDIPVLLSDPSKAKKLLNLYPQVSIEEGIEQEIKWFKEECL